jgi:protease-4
LKIINFILRGLLFIVKEIISFFIKIFLLLLVIVSLIGVFSAKKFNKEITIARNTYVEIDFSRRIMEKRTNIPNFFNEREISFYTIIKTLNEISRDPSVNGIILKLDRMGLNYGQIEELSEILQKIKANGKKIYAHTTRMNNRNYWFAIQADKIMMPPSASASVDITGYYLELEYYKNFMDRIGVSFNVIHVGDYKSYGENYTKSRMSNEFRENLTEIYDKIYKDFINDISIKRAQNKDKFENKILNGDLVASSPQKLLEIQMIDGLIYYEEFKRQFGNNVISINKYMLANTISPKITNRNKIAIITAEGEIIDTKTRARGYIYPEAIITDLEKAKNDISIKGIVLRVNSPGGSAIASDIIANKVQEVGRYKPVYVSIGGTAASGGYYISAYATKIYADRNSVTGSIGVVSLIPNFSKLLDEKGNINIETIKKGNYSDLYSVFTAFNVEKAQKLYKSSEAVYEDFLTAVATGRRLKKEDVHKIGQGKVWLGSDAMKNGLVDEIGGLSKCIEDLARNLKLPDYSVIEITTVSGLNSFFEENVPFANLINHLNELELNKDYYFRPMKYFPYDIK